MLWLLSLPSRDLTWPCAELISEYVNASKKRRRPIRWPSLNLVGGTVIKSTHVLLKWALVPVDFQKHLSHIKSSPTSIFIFHIKHSQIFSCGDNVSSWMKNDHINMSININNKYWRSILISLVLNMKLKDWKHMSGQKVNK